jgi:hypothetical protein
LGADAYWRNAFVGELTDSVIMRTLTNRPSSLLGAPIRARRRCLRPRLYNQLGAVGLAPLAMLINAGLATAQRLGL